MNTVAQEIATRDFGKTVINALAKKGVTIQGITSVPGPTGGYANGGRAYECDVNGQTQVKTYQQVIDIVNVRKLVGMIRDALMRDRYVTLTDGEKATAAGTGRVIGARVKSEKFEVRMMTGAWVEMDANRESFKIG